MHQLAQGAADRWTYRVLAAFLVAIFALGGASRADVHSLALLRPLAVPLFFYALSGFDRDLLRTHHWLLGFAAAIATLAVIHIVPLPPTLWSLLPGRDIVAEIDRVGGLGAVWRPLALVPFRAWDTIFDLFVPFAAGALALRIGREDHYRLLRLVVGLGAASGLLGLAQAVADANSPLYLYRITNNGSAVGLFANRNHQAFLLALLFPMLAVFATAGVRTPEQARLRAGIALAAGAVLVPLILVTGSRGGVIAGTIGLGAAALLYRTPAVTGPKRQAPRRFDPRYAIAGLAIVVLGGLTIIMSRAAAFQRLWTPDATEETRVTTFAPAIDLLWRYFPAGSGAGSFAEVYQIGEPEALLGPTYLNHAHNDWLETAITFGVPGVLLLIAGFAGFAAAARRAWARARPVDPLARLGSVIVSIIALVSLGDYPLRTPILAALFAVACVWLVAPARRAADKTTGV